MFKLIHTSCLYFGFLQFYIIAYTTLNKLFAVFFIYNIENIDKSYRIVKNIEFFDISRYFYISPVAYLEGGTVRCPPWHDHEFFLQATLYEKVRFLPFSSKNCKIQQCLTVFCVSKFQKNGQICGFH